MVWFYLSLLAVFLWAIVNIVDKFAIDRFKNQALVPIIINEFVGLVISFLILLVHPIALPNIFVLGIALGTAVALIAAEFFYFKALFEGEVSRVISVILLMPLFVLLFATVFLGEILKEMQYIGIFLLVFGSILVSIKKGEKFRMGKAFWLILIATILFSIPTITRKYLMQYLDFWEVFFWIRIFCFVIALFLLLLFRNQIIESVKSMKKIAAISAGGQTINILAELAYTGALAFGLASLVQSVNALQPFFVLVMATAISLWYPSIFKEEIERKTILLKIVAIALMIIGTYFVVG